MGSCRSSLYTPSRNRGRACREVTEARGLNRGHIWALRFSCDNRLAGNGFVGVTGQSGCKTFRMRRHANPGPTEMKATLDLELCTQIAILHALATVHPGTAPMRRLSRRIGLEVDKAHADWDAVTKSVAILDFCASSQRSHGLPG